MKKRKSGIRRIAALVCSVALLATLLPVQAFAAGDGTSPSANVENVEPQNGEETPDPVVSCTKDLDCQADTHEEGCPKYPAPDGEETPDPVVSCTKTEDCQAETHEEGCPKYVEPDGEGTPGPVVSCTKTEDCQADTHEEGCPKYVEPDGEGTPGPAVSCTKTEDCQADTHEEGCPKYPVPDTYNVTRNNSELVITITEADMEAEETAIAAAVARLQIMDVADVTSLKVTTEGTAYLSPSDNEYIKTNFTALTSLDESECQCSVRRLTESYLTKSGLEDREYAEFGGLSEFAGLTTLVLPKTAEVINSYSVNKTGLNDLNIPEGVLLIESGAFSGNTKLTGNIVIPDSVVFVGNNAFGLAQETAAGCGTLTLGNSLKYIDNNGFAHRFFTGNLVIPDSVEYIGNWVFTGPAFEGGTWTLGKGLKHIGDAALSDICSGNRGTLFIPAQLAATSTAFGYNTFSKVEFEDGITTISAYIVRGSESVTEVVLPQSVETIGSGAFLSCAQLSRVTIPDGVTAINRDAFGGTALEGVYLPASISSLGAKAFDDLPQNSVIYVDNDAVYNLVTTANTDQWNRRYDSSKTALAVTNGGSFAADTQFTAGTLATPTKNGFVFEGWYDNADLNGEPVTTAEAGKTYYAKWFDLELQDVSLEYQQKKAFTAPDGAEFSDWKSEDDSVATVENGTIQAVGLGETTISVVGTVGDNSATAKIHVTVTPMNITFGTGKGENPGGTIVYQYNGGEAPAFSTYATFYPATISEGSVSPVESSSPVTLVEGKDIVFNYDAGGGNNGYEYLPLDVTSEKGLSVTVKMLNENYRFVTNSNATPGTELQLSVVVTDGNLTESEITGLGTATLSFTYDGTGKAAVTGLTDIAADNISEFTLHFHGWHSTAFAEQHLTGDASKFTDEAVAKIAPTKPGSYLMILTGKSSDHYTYKSWIMTINKATVTITATDKTAVVGAALPDLSNPAEGEDYTVTGLVGNDQLTAKPTLTYDAGASTDSMATYKIIPSGAAVDEQYYNAPIEYVNGTLKVEGLAIIAGANQTWTQGSGKDLVITSNAEFEDFKKVTVNGETLAQGQDYTVREGSTIVTIKAAYLESLPAGDYDFAIVSKPGAASTRFTVKAKAAGDSETTGGNGSGSSGTTAPSGSTTPYYTCPACGYHNWTATADGYKCDHCGYLESVKQLSGYGNVKGVYEPKTSSAAAQPAAASASSAAIPQTGDALPVGLLGGVAAVAAVTFVALLVLRKRKRDD